MAVELKSLSISGYKTFKDLPAFEPGRLSVLVGGNGSGKSNFVSFFTLLNRMMEEPGELQLSVSQAGGAGRLLFDGAKKTESIKARLDVETESGINTYEFRLGYAAGDSLIFLDESFRFHGRGHPSPLKAGNVGGHRESILHDHALTNGAKWIQSIRSLLRMCRAYQFHDTSFTSGMRAKSSSRGNGLFLQSDGSNIGGFLHRLSIGANEEQAAYQRIQETIRQVLPFFASFVLEPEDGYVLIRWRERGSEEVFAASQASDGMLRFIALVALLCQPPQNMPAIMLLDEPELGLHPQAIAVLASLIRSVAVQKQVIVATQSIALVDEFTLDEIVVARRKGRETTLERLKEEDYLVWREEYSAGELWRMNVFGGGPAE